MQAYSYHAISTYYGIDRNMVGANSSTALALLPTKENLKLFKGLLLEIFE
jgi:hypothetical protein